MLQFVSTTRTILLHIIRKSVLASRVYKYKMLLKLYSFSGSFTHLIDLGVNPNVPKLTSLGALAPIA